MDYIYAKINNEVVDITKLNYLDYDNFTYRLKNNLKKEIADSFQGYMQAVQLKNLILELGLSRYAILAKYKESILLKDVDIQLSSDSGTEQVLTVDLLNELGDFLPDNTEVYVSVITY